MGSIQERLKARWAKQGSGPAVEARLKAAQEELRRREAEDRARARGVKLPPSKAPPAPPPPRYEEPPATPPPRRPKPAPPPRVPFDDKRRPKNTVHIESLDSDEDSEDEAPGPAPRPPPGAAPPEPNDPAVLKLKEDANQALTEGEYEEAVQLYTQAFEVGKQRGGIKDRELASVLYNNRALAHMRLENWEAAALDARAAHTVRPTWAKPLYRFAQASCELGRYKMAIEACRQGEQLLEEQNDHSKEFTPLMDRISHLAALNGSLAGFDGRVIYVRCAGEDAWLGKEAPENPLFEDEAEADISRGPLLLENPELLAGGVPGGDHAVMQAELAAKRVRDRLQSNKPLTARNLILAAEMAKDGDRILVLKGIHNFGGDTVVVDKRVLIRGEGHYKETYLDQRANAPLFRITRNAVIQNLDCDLTGFRECVLVTGDENVKPIIEHCIIKSSGADGLNITARAQPTFRDCDIMGRKAGGTVMGEARPEFVDCKFNTNTLMGMRCMEKTAPLFRNCLFNGNIEDGVVVMEDCHAEFIECHMRDNKGTGVDVSGNAHATLRDCYVKNNVGGLFMWDDARAFLYNCRVNGGQSHALLADLESIPRLKNCSVEGIVQATENAWKGVRNGTNKLVQAPEPTFLPLEEGAFKFEANRFTRKQ